MALARQCGDSESAPDDNLQLKDFPLRQIQASQLVRFSSDNLAHMDMQPTVLEELANLATPLRIISFMGKGRVGKSQLANLLAGHPEAFACSDRIQSMTSGIDYLTIPNPGQDGGTVVIFDCEGFDNPFSPSRHSVGTLMLLVSTAIVSVGAGHADDSQLQVLERLIASRMFLIGRGRAAVLNQPVLHHVVNMCHLRGYKSEHLDQVILSDQTSDDARNGTRRAIKQAFEPRVLHSIPHKELKPDEYHTNVTNFRQMVFESAAPAVVDGVPLTGKVLYDLISSGIEQLNAGGGIDPSCTFDRMMSSHVKSIGDQIAAKYETCLPQLEDYIESLCLTDQYDAHLAEFDSQVAHLDCRAIIQEQRRSLEDFLHQLNGKIEAKNAELKEIGYKRARDIAVKLQTQFAKSLPSLDRYRGDLDSFNTCDQVLKEFDSMTCGMTSGFLLQQERLTLSAGLDGEFLQKKSVNEANKRADLARLKAISDDIFRHFLWSLASERYVHNLMQLDTRTSQLNEFDAKANDFSACPKLTQSIRTELKERLATEFNNMKLKNKKLENDGHEQVKQMAKKILKTYQASIPKPDGVERDLRKYDNPSMFLNRFDMEALGRTSPSLIQAERKNLALAMKKHFLAKERENATLVNTREADHVKNACTEEVQECMGRCMAAPLAERHQLYHRFFEQERYLDSFTGRIVEPQDTAYVLHDQVRDHVQNEMLKLKTGVFGEEFVRKQMEESRFHETSRHCPHCGIVYTKEAGCASVRCGFTDWHQVPDASRGDKVYAPPPRGQHGRIHGCGHLFDWNVASPVTIAEQRAFFEPPVPDPVPKESQVRWRRAFQWALDQIPIPNPFTFLGTLMPAHPQPIGGRTQSFKDVADQICKQLRDEKSSMSLRQRQSKFRELMLAWHPDRSSSPYAKEVTQLLNEKRDWYLQ